MDESKELPDFPFATNADDHCESPAQAYKDILPLLRQMGDPFSLRIYDPYYCDGAVVRNLAELGFPNVYNKKEDCYAVWSAGNSPQFDVVITNPPYSNEHIEKLIRHVTSDRSFGKRPWFLLLPVWVHKKEFYQQATSQIRPFYIVPHKRYVYQPPTNFRRAKKSDTHKKSSPWTSMWYCWGGTTAKNEDLIQQFYRSSSSSSDHGSSSSCCDLARSKSALRDLRRKKR
jgi:hypothetical protein